MSLAVVYTTVGGMLLHESRGGAETFYVPDPLGSVVQTKDASGTATSETEYWPYGEVQSSTGTNPSPWGYVGTLGYLKDSSERLYVRARYYRPATTRWTTVDPLWPDESAYGYVEQSSTMWADPSGLGSGNGLSDVCAKTLHKCIEPYERFLSACQQRSADRFRADILECSAGQPQNFTKCAGNAAERMRLASDLCRNRIQPSMDSCWRNYKNCTEKRDAAERARQADQAAKLAAIAAGAYCVYRICKAAVGIAAAPATGGCSLIIVFTP